MGVNQTNGLMDFVKGTMGIDSVHMADFMKGLLDGVQPTSKKEKAYLVGVQVGQQISDDRMFNNYNKQLFDNDSTLSLSKDDFIAGFIESVRGKAVFTMNDARNFIQTHAETIKAKTLEKKYADNKAAGEKFLAENKTKEGVVTTESGLQYKIIKAGKGEIPTNTSTVKVNYKGTLIDGTEFDSSYKRNEPASFRADQVIKGWTEALTMMPVGSKWELYIPQELAYGSRDTGGQIKPFSTLIFEVELLGIEKKK